MKWRSIGVAESGGGNGVAAMAGKGRQWQQAAAHGGET